MYKFHISILRMLAFVLGLFNKPKLCVLTFIVDGRVNDDEIARDNNILTQLKWARVFSTQIYVYMPNKTDKTEKKKYISYMPELLFHMLS